MYLDETTVVALICMAMIAAGAWFWNDSLRARERMTDACRRLCRELKVQFLDESVALVYLGIARKSEGGLELMRRYAFEFSGTGQDRWQGRVTLAGQRVLSVQFDHPQGVTILGGAAPVSPDILRLTQSTPPGEGQRLH